MRKIVFLFFLLVSFSTQAETNDATIAIIDGIELKQTMFKQHFATKGYKPAPDEATTKRLQLHVANELIDILLLSEEAVVKKLDQQNDIQQAIDLARRNILSKALIKKYIADFKVTEEAITKAYQLASLEAKNKTEYKAKHILVNSKNEALSIIKKLEDKELFGALAKEYSTGPSSIKEGDLGWFTPQIMPIEFSKAIKKLNKKEFTTSPVKTDFGWHIILLEDIRPFDVPDIAQVRPKLIALIKKQHLQEKIQHLRQKVKIKAPNTKLLDIN